MLTKIKGLHHLTSMGASTQENSDLPRRSATPRKEDCEFRRGGLSPLLQRRHRHAWLGDDLFSVSACRQGTSGCRIGRDLFRHRRGHAWLLERKTRFLRCGRTFGARTLGREAPSLQGSPTGMPFRWSQSMASALRFGSTEVDPDKAITGFHRTSLPLKDAGATRELISFMGYQEVDRKGDWSSFAISGGNGADVIALETVPKADLAASALARCITSPSPWTIGRLSSRFARPDGHRLSGNACHRP